jgi:hypothetical protein
MEEDTSVCVSMRLWLHSNMHIMGSFFLDPEDIMNLIIGDIKKFDKVTGLL